jgi:hypothetical protein
MPNLCLPPLLAALLALPAAAQVGDLETDLRHRISGETGAVSLAYLGGGPHDSLLIDGHRRYHAASTMKVPVARARGGFDRRASRSGGRPSL